jgi:hypothetical protein
MGDNFNRQRSLRRVARLMSDGAAVQVERLDVTGVELLEVWHAKLVAYDALIHELHALGAEERLSWDRMREILLT